MLFRIALGINIVALIVRVILLPFLPPQTAYVLSLLIGWWALMLTVKYFYPKMSMLATDVFPYPELETNFKVLG